MNSSMDSFQRRIINPVWSDSHKFSRSPQGNMWPMRQQNHFKRFYGNSKSKPSTPYHPTINQNEIVPVTMKLDTEEFDQHKSYTSMAFCSTSKVKYMPISTANNDPFAGLTLGTPHPIIFPTLSRPVSRPVLLHGKRYTVIATETNRTNTAFSHFDQDESGNFFKPDHTASEQRKRFNEVEQSKSGSRPRGMIADGPDIQLHRNYCLSGRQMKLRSPRTFVPDTIVKLQPTLQLRNRFMELKKPHQFHQLSDSQGSNLHADLGAEQISLHGNSDSIISIDIRDKVEKSVPLDVEEAIQSIRKIRKNYESIPIDDDLFVRSKEWVIDLILSCLGEYAQLCNSTDNIFDGIDVDSAWDLLQPILPEKETEKITKTLNSSKLDEYKDSFHLSDLDGIDAATLLDVLFSDKNDNLDRHYWTKIFYELNIDSISESRFSDLISMKKNLHCLNQNGKANEENLAMVKLSFWISLFKQLSYTSVWDTEKWIRKTTSIILNTNAITEEQESTFFNQTKQLLSAHCKEGQLNTSTLDYTETVPWLFRLHQKIFTNPFTIDEIAKIRYLQFEGNDQ